MKILVVGFPRSGTSLTYRIFKKHPDVKQMIFERWMLKQADTKQQLISLYPFFNSTCGEKVIWAKRVTGKIGKTKNDIIDYCNQWNDWFGNEARIVQIIRHPFDSLNSLVISKKRLPRGPSFENVYREYLKCAGIFVDGIRSIPNCMTIKYESLITDSDSVIKKLYSHCNIDPTFQYPEKMKQKRVLNYQEKDFLFNYDERLEKIIDVFNETPGVKYHGLQR